jgi:Leucine-rich repeat (LRR) protein
MSVFPIVLTKLAHMSEIYANTNSFSIIPEEISNLTKLKLLKLSNNNL